MNAYRVAAIVLGVATYLGCSNVKFQSTPSSTCLGVRSTFGSDACIESEDGTNTYRYTVRVGEVDLLFVDDNSGSMYVEQNEMANRFPGFLDSIRDLNYQIAITTTDVSASPNNPPDQFNQNGALQDGRLIKFPNGESVLSNTKGDSQVHGQNISYFQDTIRRPESQTCTGSVNTTCVSSDERGIYAMNMALDRSENQSLFRAGGHLAIVILSDEDERSAGGTIPGYALEEYDLPATFVSKAKQTLHPTKSVSVSSIIIRPGDSSCHSIQNSQAGVKGFYGTQYAALTKPNAELMALGPIVPGSLGSICSSNYTAELGSIANLIKDQTLGSIQLACKPIEGSVQMEFEPPATQAVQFSVDEQNRLNFSPQAAPGTKVKLTYKCNKTS